MDRQTDRLIDEWIYRQINRNREDKQIDEQIDGWKDRWMYKQIEGRQIDKQIEGRWIDKQIGCQTNRQIKKVTIISQIVEIKEQSTVKTSNGQSI